MLEKIKQKLHGSSDSDNTPPNNDSTPSINEPSSDPSSRHESEQSIDQPSRLSTSEDRGRRASLAAANRNPAANQSRSRSRARDILLKNNGPQGVPDDSKVRAKSMSTDVMHPTVAEEEMKKMPYQSWSKK